MVTQANTIPQNYMRNIILKSAVPQDMKTVFSIACSLHCTISRQHIDKYVKCTLSHEWMCTIEQWSQAMIIILFPILLTCNFSYQTIQLSEYMENVFSEFSMVNNHCNYGLSVWLCQVKPNISYIKHRIKELD